MPKLCPPKPVDNSESILVDRQHTKWLVNLPAGERTEQGIVNCGELKRVARIDPQKMPELLRQDRRDLLECAQVLARFWDTTVTGAGAHNVIVNRANNLYVKTMSELKRIADLKSFRLATKLLACSRLLCHDSVTDMARIHQSKDDPNINIRSFEEHHSIERVFRYNAIRRWFCEPHESRLFRQQCLAAYQILNKPAERRTIDEMAKLKALDSVFKARNLPIMSLDEELNTRRDIMGSIEGRYQLTVKCQRALLFSNGDITLRFEAENGLSKELRLNPPALRALRQGIFYKTDIPRGEQDKIAYPHSALEFVADHIIGARIQYSEELTRPVRTIYSKPKIKLKLP